MPWSLLINTTDANRKYKCAFSFLKQMKQMGYHLVYKVRNSMATLPNVQTQMGRISNDLHHLQSFFFLQLFPSFAITWWQLLAVVDYQCRVNHEVSGRRQYLPLDFHWGGELLPSWNLLMRETDLSLMIHGAGRSLNAGIGMNAGANCSRFEGIDLKRESQAQ